MGLEHDVRLVHARGGATRSLPFALIGCLQLLQFGVVWNANLLAIIGVFVVALAHTRGKGAFGLAIGGQAIGVGLSMIVLSAPEHMLFCLDDCESVTSLASGTYLWIASLAVLPLASFALARHAHVRSRAAAQTAKARG